MNRNNRNRKNGRVTWKCRFKKKEEERITNRDEAREVKYKDKKKDKNEIGKEKR